MKSFVCSCALLITLAMAAGCAPSQSSADLQGAQRPLSLYKEIRTVVNVEYLLYLPKRYKAEGAPMPLIMFLHGAGERGSDLEKVKVHGPPKIVEENDDFPFVVVSPQCPKDSWWTADTLNALLDEILANHNIDENRVYLTGLSMGGFGTWTLATEHPDRFAAIAPICGGGSPVLARHALKRMPTWVFHGEKDTVVPISNSEEMVEALKRAGGDVKFTRYPNAGHDSWIATYDNPELYEWFLQHKRKRN